MADHTKTGTRDAQGGNWTGSSCKRTRYISRSVNADRTLMIIKMKEVTMFKSALANLVH